MSRNSYPVAREEDLAEGDRVIVDVEGKEIAVFNVDGEYHAMLNFCVHQGGPLCEGGVVDGAMYVPEGEEFWQYDPDRRCVSCPWHNWRFDIETGKNVTDGSYAVPTYDVDVTDGDVVVRV